MNVEKSDAGSGERRKRGHLSLVAAGALLTIIGASLLVGGVAVLYFNQEADRDGFVLSNTYDVRSPAYAFVIQTDFSNIPSYLRWLNPGVQSEWVVSGVNQSQELFVGYARYDDALNYEYDSGVMFETPSDYHYETGPYYVQFDVDQTIVNGLNAPGNPSQEAFWLQSSDSKGPTVVYWNGNRSASTMTWKPGEYALVIMNPDGSRNVQAEIQMGFRVTILSWLPTLLLPLGVVLVAAGALLMRRNRG